MSADTRPSAEIQAYLDRIRDLEERLEESEETLDAIRKGDFDAVVVEGAGSAPQVYTLENTDRPYRVLIEQIREGALTISHDGTVLYCNQCLAQMLGVPQERLIGQSLHHSIPDEERPAFSALLEEAWNGAARAELTLRTTRGATLPVYVSLSPLHRDDATPILCGVITDQTEQRQHLRDLADANRRLEAESVERGRAEDALRQSQKMQAIGQLTGGIAHDFNNLLTVIRSSSDLLKRPDLAEERRARYVAAISDTVDRASKLTGQLLSFARRQALKPEVFEAGQSIRMIGDMVTTLTGPRIRIVTDIPEAPSFINADPSQFDTAIVNMAINARDAMGSEGQLTIAVRRAAAIPAARAHATLVGDFVAVSLADNGIGIPPDQIERIFEPFFTTKGVGKGTGLGLSQVFGFAKQSGGEIRVESEVGRGTTFTLYLPRVPEAMQRTETANPEPLMDGYGTCVLVIEDNTEVGVFATQTLAELGYTTVWSANAEEALAELADDADRFDVVFSDVIMPGMDGTELAQEIRRRHPDLPVVLTSGYSHVLAEHGTHGFELLQKPYSIEQLSRVLRKAASWTRRRRILAQRAAR